MTYYARTVSCPSGHDGAVLAKVLLAAAAAAAAATTTATAAATKAAVSGSKADESNHNDPRVHDEKLRFGL